MTAATQPDLRWQQRRGFLVGISASAGRVDVLAFLYFGKAFISFMSGNLLFLGIGAGNGGGGLVLRARAVLGPFLAVTAIGARLTGSGLVPGAVGPLRRALLLEAGLLAAFALLWLATGEPDDHATMTVVLLAVGAA